MENSTWLTVACTVLGLTFGGMLGMTFAEHKFKPVALDAIAVAEEAQAIAHEAIRQRDVCRGQLKEITDDQ